MKLLHVPVIGLNNRERKEEDNFLEEGITPTIAEDLFVERVAFRTNYKQSNIDG